MLLCVTNMPSEALTHADLEEILDKKLDEMYTKKLAPLQDALNFLSGKYDELINTISQQDTSIKNLVKENQALKMETGSLKASSQRNQNWLNDLEQYGRRECLEIRGIPPSPQENTTDLICKVANLAGVEISPADISTSHRIKPKADTTKFPPAIVAKFVCCDTRDELYRAKGRLGGFTTKDLELGRTSENAIYISESLTDTNRSLFKNALKVRKDLKFKFIWTNYGKVFLRKDEQSQAILIKSKQDLEHLSRRQNDAAAV